MTVNVHARLWLLVGRLEGATDVALIEAGASTESEQLERVREILAAFVEKNGSEV